MERIEYDFPKKEHIGLTGSLERFSGSTSKVLSDGEAEEVPFTGKYPVIFIPGLMGSQLEVTLKDRQDPPNWLCRRTNEKWERIWIIDDVHLLPELVDCWLQTINVRWNATSGKLEPWSEGIESRYKPGFDGAMNLGPNTEVLSPIAQWMSEEFGYKVGVDLVAQPYDWRAGPETWMKAGGVFDEMKALIEKTVDSRPGKEPIVAWSISMGGPFFSLFLNKHVSEEWKARYIHTFFSVSGVMSGSVIAPFVSFSGTKFGGGIPSFLKSALDQLATELSSIAWIYPHDDAFGDKPIIQTTERNFTSAELGEALLKVNNKQQATLLKKNLHLYGLQGLVPNVTTYCMSGYGVPTFGALDYGEKLEYGKIPKTIMTDGDNCVPVESLRVCDDFGLHQEQPVFPYHIYNQTHGGLAGDTQTMTLFAQVFTGIL
ncbi:lecithin:cholesterol acyltransferase [Chloropicon primus]|uniref:Lecithin:cholesterol acyltransferase n=1 Tax=Chloropicon primus TaxID=1764295 RepID=A0A5B8MZT7_9CHLO|nr:lecithin:cholesterol acyltransferase [Chloropicon primus]UPR05016.1 lecithin:cholesterol acyltransferase [Chloropicon primus]|eukprot:QDZ25821.1 lecithin:cholesterol acyltransferase [Chloropicon primus]